LVLLLQQAEQRVYGTSICLAKLVTGGVATAAAAVESLVRWCAPLLQDQHGLDDPAKV
jgi:hypothetical protein